MKQIFLITIFVCVLQLIQGYAYHKDPIIKSIINIDAKSCTTAGKLCKSCSELVDCIQIGDDQFIEVDVKHCDTGNKEFCNSALKDCSTAPNPSCAGNGAKDFTCHNTGIFPDPLDCHIYHMCAEPQHKLEEEEGSGEGSGEEGFEGFKEENQISHIGLKCDDNLGYNPISTYCETNLSNNECPISGKKGEIPIICEKLGEAHAIKSTSMFYVCITETETGNLVPHLYMCPAGGSFNEETNICERKTYPSTTSNFPSTTTPIGSTITHATKKI